MHLTSSPPDKLSFFLMVNILAKKSLNSKVLLFVFTQLVKISIEKKI
jgi:hypothetical protein